MKKNERWLAFNIAWMREQILCREIRSSTDFGTDNNLLHLLAEV